MSKTQSSNKTTPQSKTTIFAADLFAGAGGASLGLARACEALGYELDLVAVNHWPRAVETHLKNFPTHVHHCHYRC